MNAKQGIEVWDITVRLFHWGLVLSFTTAYLTEDDFMRVHTYAGYTIIGLVLFRLIWGVIGSYHARFNHFVCSPTTTLAYMKDILYHRSKRYIGHNPAGGVMVLALLTSLIITTVTGLATYATEELSGPLVNLMQTAPSFIYDAAEEVHEFFANFTVVLVVFHVIGVVIASFSHKENLVRAMVTGIKRGD